MAEASRPMTAAQKVLARASNRPFVAIGEVIHPDPELVIIHDGYVETSYAELGALGYRRVPRPERVMFVTDHEVAYATQRAVERGRAIRRIAKEWQVGHFFDVGRGGHGHIFPMEAGHVRPGMFLFAYDMHCTNFGAVGALAIGAGAEITTVLATGTLWTEVPSSVLIDLKSSLPPGVHARDVGFLLSKGFTHGDWDIDADNRVIEFAGRGIADFDLAARVALCNTLTEIGVANVLFAAPPPGMDRAAAADFLSDADADYAGRVTIDLASLKPQVALPGAPDNAADIDTVVGTPIDHAFIGACGSSMYEDFVAAAHIMRGQRVADRVRLFVGPGTNKITERLANEGLLQEFMEAGATVLPPGCGPCAGGAMAPLGPKEVSISTAATNHAGRFGAKDGEVYLGSPLTVAASAIAGRLVDPRETLGSRGRK
ncbi:MAG TPA: aconitase family protein [Stellaceae bacterium]|jgi:3-isopropylmalate/(R)-2-methylmalate dehydratase large subunit|nr:aconitase family protein [Stellaceae bacterium]